MKLTRREALISGVGAALSLTARSAHSQEETPWPPALRGAQNGTVTLRSDRFLEIPKSVTATGEQPGLATFTMAKTAPTVDLALHGNLGPDPVGKRQNGRIPLWSSWGDIALASDGRVYCGIGDHGDDQGGDARCFIYRWDPKRKVLEQIVDMNQASPRKPGQPAWSKVHAKIDEAADGKIYFSCTLNDGNRASLPGHNWSDAFPGGQIYQYDPGTGRTTVFANLPRARCTATSLVDRERNLWWCNLESGPKEAQNTMWALDLGTRKPVFEGEPGAVDFNRNFAMARDGSIYFNGEKGAIMKIDGQTRRVSATRSAFEGSPGMRSSSRESRDGAIYGTSHGSGQIFCYRPAKDELRLLGSTWGKGEYVTVCELSPDERFLYYLPGAHGGAIRYGTPVIQYDIANGRRKVLAFLQPAFEEAYDYVPAGTYGVKISADGGTLFVNFNGEAGDRIRAKNMPRDGFGLTSFAAIHIPASER